MSNMLTEVHLLNVPLENDYKHTLFFETKTGQQQYFYSKRVSSAYTCSYLRKDNVIRFPACIDDLINCNYVMYKNQSHSNKWYYAFITKMEYKNDEMTEIYIETDVLQTYLVDLDYTIKPSFVEREHVNDDTVGLHTVPEMVETGEYVCNELVKDTELEEYSYIIQVTEDTNAQPMYATNYGGVWNTGGAYICKTGLELTSIINLYNNNKKSDAIIGVYLVPTKIINNSNSTEEVNSLLYSGQTDPVTYMKTFSKQKTLDGYTPRNKKLLTYPFNYILFSNNNGSSNILQYENFSSEDCQFKIAGVPSVGGSIKCCPNHYKGLEQIQQEGLLLGKFPTTSWYNDLYTNWLTQNAVNIGVGLASSGLQVLGGVGMMMTGAGGLAGAGMVASGGVGIAQTLGQVYQHSLTPNSAEGNTNGGDINTCYKTNLFYFYKMSIKKEYAKIIDEYFDMFGYKVNRVKTPLKNHRSNYWYTKTIDVNIDGAIPMQDMKKIKECYNRGVTFWLSPANIGNYSVLNDIVVKEM